MNLNKLLSKIYKFFEFKKTTFIEVVKTEKLSHSTNKFDCQKLATRISKNETINKLKDFTLLKKGKSSETFRTLFSFKVEDVLIQVWMHAKNSKYENLYLFIKNSEHAKKIFDPIRNDELFLNIKETREWSNNAPRTLILRESLKLYSKWYKATESMIEKMVSLF